MVYPSMNGNCFMVHVVLYCYSKYRLTKNKKCSTEILSGLVFSMFFLKSYTIVGDEFDEEKSMGVDFCSEPLTCCQLQASSPCS